MSISAFFWARVPLAAAMGISRAQYNGQHKHREGYSLALHPSSSLMLFTLCVRVGRRRHYVAICARCVLHSSCAQDCCQ